MTLVKLLLPIFPLTFDDEIIFRNSSSNTWTIQFIISKIWVFERNNRYSILALITSQVMNFTFYINRCHKEFIFALNVEVKKNFVNSTR